MKKIILRCDNCGHEVEQDDLYKEKSWHACWLNNKNQIKGYQQEGTFLKK